MHVGSRSPTPWCRATPPPQGPGYGAVLDMDGGWYWTAGELDAPRVNETSTARQVDSSGDRTGAVPGDGTLLVKESGLLGGWVGPMPVKPSSRSHHQQCPTRPRRLHRGPDLPHPPERSLVPSRET